MSKSSSTGAGARTRARELMVQALYQKQIAGHTTAELVAQYHEDTAYQRVDQAFFDELPGDGAFEVQPFANGARRRQEFIRQEFQSICRQHGVCFLPSYYQRHTGIFLLSLPCMSQQVFQLEHRSRF